MIELSTGILATANLRFSRIVCHSNKYVGTFAALGQRSRFDVHAKVLLVFTFGRDVQRSSIFGDSGVQRGLESGGVVADQLLGTVDNHLRSERTVQLEATRIVVLPIGVLAGRKTIVPANSVPVIDMFTQH